MSLQIRLTRDYITPDLRKKVAALENPTPILRAMGTQLVSITKRAFCDPSLRSVAWPAKRGGSPSNLTYKGVLVSSIRITDLSASSVTVGSDRKYAAIHQMGGTIKAKPGKSLVFTIGGKTIFAKEAKLPARPFFPFLPSGAIATFANESVEKAIEYATETALNVIP